MKNNIIRYFYIALLTVAVTSCNDDFLEKLPETSIGRENFFNTEEDLTLYIYNLYNFPSTGIYSTDSYTMTDNGWNTGNVELKTMMISNPSSITITSGWDWSQLRDINFFLENYGNASISEERLNHFEGLGRFFRARFYVDKVKRYSDVPWIDVVVADDNEEVLFNTRDSREFVVGKIMEDFEFAIANIGESSSAGTVNRQVAKAEYARFALYEGTYRRYHSELNLVGSATEILRKAADVSKDIMDNGGFSIYNTGHPETDYGSLFYNSDLSNHPEVIFARIYQTDILDGDAGDGFFGNYEAFPLKDLLQSYLMSDGSFYSSHPEYQLNEFIEEFENRDPRLYQTFAYPGWELKRSGTYAQGSGIYVQQLAKNFSGYHQIKGFYNTQDWTERNSIDVPIYRYAEILLIYAEARAELGELTQADLDASINLLRRRAGMPDMPLNPPVDPIQAAKFSNVSSPQRAAILEIRRERRIELALEGFRYEDLMRWEVGKLLEREPQGIYFSRLGEHDLNGDNVPDIILLPSNESIPAQRETNTLGAPFLYYRIGHFGEDVSVFLSGDASGYIQIVDNTGTFVVPKYYYRPVPQEQVTLNPALTQIFGWE